MNTLSKLLSALLVCNICLVPHWSKCCAQTTNSAPTQFTTAELRGRHIEGIATVTFNSKTGKITVMYSGGGGVYQPEEFTNEFLEAWGIRTDKIAATKDKIAEEKERSQQEKSRRIQRLVDSFPGLGSVSDNEETLGIFKKSKVSMTRYGFSTEGLNDARRTVAQGYRLSNNSMSVEREIALTLPVSVYQTGTDDDLKITLVAIGDKVIRVRVQGVNRIVDGGAANKVKFATMQLLAVILEKKFEGTKGEDSRIVRMLEKQTSKIERLNTTLHDFCQGESFYAFSCIYVGRTTAQYLLNICDTRLGKLYIEKTMQGHPDAALCPEVDDRWLRKL